MVVDGDIQRLLARALRILRAVAVAGDAVAGLVQLAKLLRIEMQQLLGRLALSAQDLRRDSCNKGRRSTPAALHARVTVYWPRPTPSAMRSYVSRWLCGSATARSSLWAAARLGLLSGRELLSASRIASAVGLSPRGARRQLSRAPLRDFDFSLNEGCKILTYSAQGAVELRKCGCRWQSREASIADGTTYDKAVLLLDLGLVILPVRTRTSLL